MHWKKNPNSGKTCLVIPSPINKEICFDVPDVGNMAEDISKDVGKTIKKDVVDPAIKPVKDIADKATNEIKGLPNKVKKDVVDPAINTVKKDVINPIKDFLVGLIDALKGIFRDIGSFFKKIPQAIKDLGGEFENIGDKFVGAFESIGNFFEGIGDKVLGVIMDVIIKVVGIITKVFGAMFQLFSGIFKAFWNVIAGHVWWLNYVPYFLMVFMLLPFLFIFLLISFLLVPLIGNFAFFLPVLFIIGLPFILNMYLKEGIMYIINLDYGELFQKTLKNSPELAEKFVKFIIDKIKDAIKNINIVMGDTSAIKNIKKDVKDFINKIKNFGPLKDLELTINRVAKAIDKL